MDNETVFANLEKLKAELDVMRNAGYSKDSSNFFHLLDLTSNEQVHSGFIAWMLSPENRFNSDYQVLRKFFEYLWDYIPPEYNNTVYGNKTVKSNREILNITKDELLAQIPAYGKGYEIITEHVINNKENRIDIFIDLGNTVVVIENKVFSAVHDNQLCRYINEVDNSEYGKYKNRIFVYLSPKVEVGELPINIGGDEQYNDKYCVLDYNTINELVKWTLEQSKNKQINRYHTKLLKDYIEMLGVDILKNNNDVRAMCKDILRKYGREIKLINDYVDNLQDVLQYVKKWVIDNGMYIFESSKTNGEKKSVDFYSDALNDFYGYRKDKKGVIKKTGAGYYRCGTDGGNVVCIWHIAGDASPEKKKVILDNNCPMSETFVKLLTWDEREKKFDSAGNCNCQDESVLSKTTIDSRLAVCLQKIKEFEAKL